MGYRLFKGTESEYIALHKWVARQLGKPSKCENCGTTEDRRYHWANKSEEYRRDIADWIRLCVPCHCLLYPHKYKIKQRVKSQCRKGHERTPENIYKSPTGGNICLMCKKDYRRGYWLEVEKNKRRILRESKTLSD